MKNKRIIEVFTAGCDICKPTIEMVRQLSCSSCEIIIYDLSKPCDTKECIQKAQQYNVKSLPAIAVNGILLNCYQKEGVSETELREAGIGQPL
ncbi:glutaredoxin [Elizabethkingia bruuniana]|uniref:Glutaredoxin n=1 Tax=Elizabethkingia bruuniana TaxID=1756149 RepID=A0A7T7UWF4_9FLAO|nr:MULTISPECIES: glutaredoxin [Elizabethkingia]KGO08684.1 glutaredoxin [Elizabethkingia miricola]QCO47343.1 glutaredoxin [Elizabethkingia sp. 2-6]QDZ63365.1 glutaredoxin [Elizabethkingia bruuniana]QQN57366.1 glutaredoxin [Elizabethkingia bruuniana]